MKNSPVSPSPSPLKTATQSALLGGKTTLGAIVDVETYSSAGFIFIDYDEKNPDSGKWIKPYGKVGTSKENNPLKYCGADRYAMDVSSEILCVSYDLLDGKGVRRFLRDEPLPADFKRYLLSNKTLIAFNAEFERAIFYHIGHKRLGWPAIETSRWVCLQAKSVMAGFNQSLDGVCEQLEIGRKDSEGHATMLRFSKLYDQGKTGEGKSRLDLYDDIEAAEALFDYCDQDVKITIALNDYLTDLTKKEQRLFSLTQQMNQEGVKVDRLAMERIYALATEAASSLDFKVAILVKDKSITSINQVEKIKKELNELGVPVKSVQAKELTLIRGRLDMLKPAPDPAAKKIIDLRLANSSPALDKSRAALYRICSDDRIRGQFKYNGAISGRFTSSGIQLHNLPSREPFKSCNQCTGCKGFLMESISICPDCKGTDLTQVLWNHEIPEYIIKRIKEEYFTLGDLENRLGSGLPLLSMCLRPCLIAEEGMEFVSSDYSAIEAVILSFVAKEEWRMNIFSNQGGKIYEASGAQSQGITLEEVLQHKIDTGIHHPCRAIGKLRELSLGYMGSVNAMMKQAGSEKFTEQQLKTEVNKWREGSPKVVNLASDMYHAAIRAIAAAEAGTAYTHGGVTFKYWRDSLVVRYPSDRRVRFHQAQVITNDQGHRTIKYAAFDKNVVVKTTSILSKPKLIATIIQGMARDVLGHALDNIATAGHKVTHHIHDEICCEVPEGTLSVVELEALMNDLPDWCNTDGIKWPIFASGGWIGKRFRK